MNQYQKLNYIKDNYPLFAFVADDERLTNAKALKVIERTYNGGRFGKCGYSLALVIPRKFKNGRLKAHDYETIHADGDPDDVLHYGLPFGFDGIAGYNSGTAKTDTAIYIVLGYVDANSYYHSLLRK